MDETLAVEDKDVDGVEEHRTHVESAAPDAGTLYYYYYYLLLYL